MASNQSILDRRSEESASQSIFLELARAKNYLNPTFHGNDYSEGRIPFIQAQTVTVKTGKYEYLFENPRRTFKDPITHFENLVNYVEEEPQATSNFEKLYSIFGRSCVNKYIEEKLLKEGRLITPLFEESQLKFYFNREKGVLSSIDPGKLGFNGDGYQELSALEALNEFGLDDLYEVTERISKIIQ